METLVANLTVGKARRATLNGREYLVAPLTLIVPGVLNGSRGPLYYPPEEVSHDPTIWNGMPITDGHPTQNGVNVSARSPGVAERFQLGTVYNTTYDGKLRAEGWFDVELTRRKQPRVFAALNQGRPIELSTGLFTENSPALNGFRDHAGRPYTGLVARKYKSDHLAVLVDQRGACSLSDGCGVLINSRGRQMIPTGVSNCGGKGGKPGPCPTGVEGGSPLTKLTKTAKNASRKAEDSPTRDNQYAAYEAHDKARSEHLMAGDATKAHQHRAWAEYHRERLKGKPGKYPPVINEQTHSGCDCGGAGCKQMKKGKRKVPTEDGQARSGAKMVGNGLCVNCKNPLHPGPCKGWRKAKKAVPTGDAPDVTDAKSAKAKALLKGKPAAPQEVSLDDGDDNPNGMMDKKMPTGTPASDKAHDDAMHAAMTGKGKIKGGNVPTGLKKSGTTPGLEGTSWSQKASEKAMVTKPKRKKIPT